MIACRTCLLRPAVACGECARALAFLDHAGGMASIGRHRGEPSDCRLCEVGEATMCVECLCSEVLRKRMAPDSAYAAPSQEEFERQRWVGAPARGRAALRGPSWYRDVARLR